MLANARKDHSSPLIVIVNIIIQYIYLLSFLSPFSFLLLLFCVVLVLFYFGGGGGGVVGGGGGSQVWGICQDCALAPGTLLFLSGD